MKKKRIIYVLLISSLLLILSACNGDTATTTEAEAINESATEVTDTASTGEKIVLRAGTATERGGSYVTGLEFFKEKVEEYSDGKIEIQIFPSSQLGNERDLIEGVGLGTVEMAVSSTAPASNFSQEFLIFDMPYLIEDLQQGYEFMDGEHGQQILASLEPMGVKALGFWENGFRNITNSRQPINNPEDVKGLKIRVQENEIHQETFKLLGALPTPMAWGEVFTALQQGTIDAQENPLVIISTNKLWEAQKYMSQSEHFYSPAMMIINKDLFDGLEPDLQEAILRAEKEARDYERKFNQEVGAQAIEEMKSNGMEVNEVDKAAWVEATKPIYDQFRSKLNATYLEFFGK